MNPALVVIAIALNAPVDVRGASPDPVDHAVDDVEPRGAGDTAVTGPALSGAAPAGTVDVAGGGAQAFRFADDGAVRVVTRGVVRGTDAHRVAGVFSDPASGRTAPVLVGSSVIVRVDDGVWPRGTTPVREIFPALHMWLVESDGEDSAELAERLSDEGVDAYPNLAFFQRPLGIDNPPNDPRFAGQFYLKDVDIQDAWKLSTGSADVTVLIADNGCDLQHPDLAAKMDPGFDPFENDDDPSYVPNTEGNEHGTACAGIVAAVTDNNLDIAGTCPECRLRCARLLPSGNEPVTVDSDVLTFGFALDKDVDVVSNSWGFVDAIPVPTPLKNAIVQVQQHGRGGKGAVVVFASGNDARIVGDDELLAVPGIIGVGAVDNFGELTQFSNGGNSVDVVAPTGTLTTDISGPDGLDATDVTPNFGGTSSACPIVSGIAGLMIAFDPSKTADEIDDAIDSTAKQSEFATPDGQGHDQYYGFGLVQPAKALAALKPAKPAPKTAPPSCGCTTTAPADLAGLGVVSLAFLVVARGRRSRPS